MPQTSTLPEELIEEIFLHLPPDEPEWLVRASLASKLWLGLLSGPNFGGRYRELHLSPPMLGFLCSSAHEPMKKYPDARFVSTGKLSASFTQAKYWGYEYDLWDCRHGRVLSGNKRWGNNIALSVWDPITRRHTKLYPPGNYVSHGAAVLCAVTGCDHSACHNGPFRVVLVGTDTSDGGYFASVQESFSHTGKWSQPCSNLHLANFAYIHSMTPVLTQDALYFMLLDDGDGDDDDYVEDIAILKYDLASNGLSLIDTPLSGIIIDGHVVLMAMADGSLGFARVNMLTLYLWSRKMGSDGVASWDACRVIDLGDFLPIQNPKNELNLGIYEITLQSLEWKKIWKRENFHALVQYMSFYNPLESVKTFDAAH